MQVRVETGDEIQQPPSRWNLFVPPPSTSRRQCSSSQTLSKRLRSLLWSVLLASSTDPCVFRRLQCKFKQAKRVYNNSSADSFSPCLLCINSSREAASSVVSYSEDQHEFHIPHRRHSRRIAPGGSKNNSGSHSLWQALGPASWKSTISTLHF